MKLEPPDYEQCQALRPNKNWSPFNLGPADENRETGEKCGGSRHQDRYWRCREKPEVIVRETVSDDGILGSMSLCASCFIQLCHQRGNEIEILEMFDRPVCEG